MRKSLFQKKQPPAGIDSASGAHASQAIKKNLQPLGVIALLIVLGLGIAAVIFSVNKWSSSARIKKLKNPVPSTGPAVAAGKQLYGEHCQRCHGENGDGKGEKAGQLSLAPADLTDARKMGEATDGEFFWVITEGHLPMPPFEDKLSDKKRWQLVDYVRTFTQKPARETSSAPSQMPETDKQR